MALATIPTTRGPIHINPAAVATLHAAGTSETYVEMIGGRAALTLFGVDADTVKLILDAAAAGTAPAAPATAQTDTARRDANKKVSQTRRELRTLMDALARDEGLEYDSNFGREVIDAAKEYLDARAARKELAPESVPAP